MDNSEEYTSKINDITKEVENISGENISSIINNTSNTEQNSGFINPSLDDIGVQQPLTNDNISPVMNNTSQPISNTKKQINLETVKNVVKLYGIYIAIPIVIFIGLFFLKPNFILKEKSNKESGKKLLNTNMIQNEKEVKNEKVLDIKKYIIYSLVISLVLDTGLFMFLKYRNTL